MSQLQTLFKEWVHNQCPEVKRPNRNTDVPNAINSVDWNKLITHSRTVTIAALKTELQDAAKTILGRDAKPRDINNKVKNMARIFFVTLPAKEQNRLTEAAEALRTGLMDASAATVLGVPWEPAGGTGDATETAFPAGTSSASARRIRIQANEIAERVVSSASNEEHAKALLRAIERKVAKEFPGILVADRPCSTCQQVAPALAEFRQALDGEQLWKFDSTVSTSVALNRRIVKAWGLPVSREKWKQAKPEAGLPKLKTLI